MTLLILNEIYSSSSFVLYIHTGEQKSLKSLSTNFRHSVGTFSIHRPQKPIHCESVRVSRENISTRNKHKDELIFFNN